uniref:B mating type protein n=1 Tax=Ustilago esculenta TaxID=185366 RepID=A0A167N3K2_9BASI|nr:b mating type protein [Ustilago esculenta]QBH70115.1 homeodomain transcription factor bE1 [Ustilago esculenta]
MQLLELLTDLEEIQASLLSNNQSPDILSRLQWAQEAFRQGAISNKGDPDVRRKIQETVRSITVVSEALVQLEAQSKNIADDSAKEVFQLLRSDTEGENPLSESLPSYHMRKHFLATLDDPYPSQDDKEALVEVTNESAARSDNKQLNVHQLTLWFINARRRSGWSHILRKFACNDRNRMRLLIQTKLVSSDLPIRTEPLRSVLTHKLDDVLRENLGRQLTAEDKKAFEDDWASMISWIKYGVKEKIGSWVHDLVAANKKNLNPSQGRAVPTAAKRTPARMITTAQAKPRKSTQRASKTPSMDSNRESSGMESTPDLSTCSTVDTSFNSLSSNLSMMYYNPFSHPNDVLQSPSLNLKGGRKVKALPKRVQKLSTDSLSTGKCLPFQRTLLVPLTDHSPL